MRIHFCQNGGLKGMSRERLLHFVWSTGDQSDLSCVPFRQNENISEYVFKTDNNFEIKFCFSKDILFYTKIKD